MNDANTTGAMPQTFLGARKVRRVYRQGGGSLEVLKGVSLEVDTGGFVVIVGPSGAGKSTLLHILGLLDTPTGGQVWFEGKNLTRFSRARQARLRNELFGFVFQFFHLLPDFTALENVTLPAMVGAGILAWPARRKAALNRAKELLARVGLSERMTHRPRQLSGGEQQRVAICRALMNSPQLLLLDEPTGNLDSKTGREILNLVHGLNQDEGQTVVMVTHDPAATERATRIITLRDGAVVSE